MKQTRTEIKRNQLLWRHGQIVRLASDGLSEREIATELHISDTTVHRDIALLKQQSKEDVHKFITEQVPFEYKKTLVGLEGIIKFMSSIIADDSKETKEKMQAASIKMQALNMKMELVSSANLVEEAIDLVERYRGYGQQKGQQTIDDSNKSA